MTRPLAQEYLPGDILDACIIAQNGKIKRIVTQRRILTLPPNGGVGILNETETVPELINYSQKIISELNWSGVGQLEYKTSSQGVPKLIEFNPKFWGTLALSIEAGVNFPLLAYKHALGEQIKKDFTFTKGVRYNWFIPAGVTSLKQTKNKTQFIRQLFSKSSKSDLRYSDPLPFLQQLMVAVRNILSSS